ncbi:hypothetical protein [Nocardioides pyridinolyticus]
MTAPIPEEQDQPPTTDTTPPGEHGSELPGERTGEGVAGQDENAETSLDEPSDDSGGQ